MPTTDVCLHAATFTSQLGWIGIVWSDACLNRVTFGHRSSLAAFNALYVDGVPQSLQAAVDISPNMQQLISRLQAYSAGQRDDFLDVPIDQQGWTSFRCRVVAQCRRIPFGETRTYAQLAHRAGSPRAARAVGNVMRSNRYPLIVPCHRVVGSGGSLGGYSAPDGLDMKRRLLTLEGEG